MPKPMLETFSKSMENTVNFTLKQTSFNDKILLDRKLRENRSQAFLDAVQKLDAGGHVHNDHKVKEIMDALKNEFPEVMICNMLIGIVSVCRLGKPYEVHSLDLSGNIIRHYKAGETLPGKLEKARSIAMYGNYEFIEVYEDCCRAVSSNGTVSVTPH